MSDWTQREMKRLEAVEEEADRFLQRIAELKMAIMQGPPGTHPRQHGAVRRASLDLTRALADYRKPMPF